MSYRTRNLDRAIRDLNRNRALRQATFDKAISDRLGDRMKPPLNLDGYPDAGAVNAYHCPECDESLIVVHRDQGVTPMFLACRATYGCHGRSVSTGYRLDPARLPEPTHEWYRPAGIELARLDWASQDHVRQGGLILREIP